VTARPRIWTAVPAGFAALLAVALGAVLWRTPLPVTEAVALLEDVTTRSRLSFFIPDTPYYRPLFHATLSTIWHAELSLDARLAGIRLLLIVPAAVLLWAFVGALPLRTRRDAAAGVVGLAVLTGSAGFRDNLEIPLAYTTLGMPLALLAWCLLESTRPRAWHAPLVLVLLVAAIGFKEQGLAVVAVIVAAFLTRAPGATRALTTAAVALAAAYVAMRLTWSARLPVFEQAVGLGFRELEPAEALARFGTFPYPVYAYSALATIANVLFSEPTRGVFGIVWTITHGLAAPWEYIHLLSSLATTGLIGWWAVGALRRVRREGWSREPRAAVVLAFALLACGALSFSYSRDRLGGMALPFYALAAFYATRAALARCAGPGGVNRLALIGLVMLGAFWGVRAAGAVEALRAFSARNQLEWMTHLPARRQEFAERPTYLAVLETLRDQGLRDAPLPLRSARALIGVLGPRTFPVIEGPPATTLADAIAVHDVPRAFALVHSGLDPNELIAVRDAETTGGRDRFVSPLWWAVVMRDRDAALMLIDAGARDGRTAGRDAACQAERVGDTAMLDLLRRYASATGCQGR
jgi:hypothetical protein